MKVFSHLVVILSALILFPSCGNQSPAADESSTTFTNPESDTTDVPVALVKRGIFLKQTFSNGTLEAAQKVEIPFQIQGILREIAVRNGDFVNEGQLLAHLDDNSQQLEFAQARLAYNKALLELEDLLLGLRHSMKDTANISSDIWGMAKLRSGYEDAKLQLARKQHELELTHITAPISGIIAGLEAQTHAQSTAFKNLCTIINIKQMLVSFNLLESDAGMVKPGMTVKIMPLAFQGKNFSGSIVEIDPLINRHGQLTVKALVPNPEGLLLDGMNTRVALEKGIPNQLVIPKSAVLARQGRQVVFTFEDGLAIWNYVEIGFENEDSFAITEGLNEGQLIITGNNLTIGHQAPVRVVEKN
jgi:RND family efflux transporter MFP subunit